MLCCKFFRLKNIRQLLKKKSLFPKTAITGETLVRSVLEYYRVFSTRLEEINLA